MVNSDFPVIIIPARYASSRLPGKPLLLIEKVPLVIHVANKLNIYFPKSNIFIGTDSKEIYRKVLSFNFNAILSPSTCLTGTDRVSYCATKLKTRYKLKESTIFINVQGDEPDVVAQDVDTLYKAKVKNLDKVITGVSPILKQEEISSNSVVKMLFDNSNNLLYASRAKIPFNYRDLPLDYFKAYAIYAFTFKELFKFYSDSKTQLENIEDIEILRFLELGMKVKVVKFNTHNTSIDTVEDYNKYINAL